MTYVNSSTERDRLWFCVLDREWRMLYLGDDLASAERSAVKGVAVHNGRNRGEAMRNAAKAIAATRRERA